MDSQDSATPKILVAEDEETDAMILQMAFRRLELAVPLMIVTDGSLVVDYLEGRNGYADRAAHPMPSLLLLDLKMPRMNGFDVLRWLAEKPQFKELPVVILSSSSHASDIEKALALGAKDYQIKPIGLNAAVEMAQGIVGRWLKA